MCKAIEDMRNEAAREATREAQKKEKIQFALKLISRGSDTYEQIVELTGLTLDEVKELAAEINTPA